jgi:hypothetical protein
MVMGAKCDKHLVLHQEYQYKTRLKPLAKLNPLGKAVLNQQDLRVDVCPGEVVAVVVMVDLELCCTTGLASHSHRELSW